MAEVIQAIIKNPTRSMRNIEKATGTVTTKGNLMVETAGLGVDAAAGSTVATLAGICNQTIAAAEALTQVPVIELFTKDVLLVDSTNNSDITHNGQLMVIGANAHTINNTGTTNPAGVVKQVGVYGATGDRKILVEVV